MKILTKGVSLILVLAAIVCAYFYFVGKKNDDKSGVTIVKRIISREKVNEKDIQKIDTTITNIKSDLEKIKIDDNVEVIIDDLKNF